MKDLLDIVRVLRSDKGCPWDREQTHTSVRGALLEEAYEAADAIDTNDSTALCEELGDVLLQVVFHAQIAAEENDFAFDEVVDGICRKLVLRHPHVFGDVKADTSAEVKRNWDAIKKQEKGQNTITDTLTSVPRAFPALMRAAKVQGRAAKEGFDWPDVRGALDKTEEELAELKAAIQGNDTGEMAEELGDLFFSIVNISRYIQVDPEQAATAATDKFIGRFEKLEALAMERGLDLKTATLEEMDALWDIIKKRSTAG